jgi:hypothetical protein
MAKLSDREAERFIAQASPDAARAMEIARLEAERQFRREVARMKRVMRKETRPNIQRGGKIDDQEPPGLAEEIARFNEGKRAGHVLVGAYGLPHDARMKSYPEAEDDGVVFVTNPPWARSVPQRSTTSKRVKRPSANACGGCCAAPAK